MIAAKFQRLPHILWIALETKLNVDTESSTFPDAREGAPAPEVHGEHITEV